MATSVGKQVAEPLLKLTGHAEGHVARGCALQHGNAGCTVNQDTKIRSALDAEKGQKIVHKLLSAPLDSILLPRFGLGLDHILWKESIGHKVVGDT